MKTKLIFTFSSALLAAGLFFGTSNKHLMAQSGGACYSSDMYFCRGCTISGGLLNYKQIKLCTPKNPIEILEESN